MKKIVAFIISILFFAILVMGTSDGLMKWFYKDVKTLNVSLGSQKYIYGDLYGFSSLEKFKKIITKDKEVPVPRSEVTQKVNLYYLCDSYLYSFVNGDTIDKQFNSCVQGIWVKQNIEYDRLDTTRLNVLLIEIVERYALSLADTNIIINKIHKKNPSIKNQGSIYADAVIDHSFIEKALSYFGDISIIYNDYIESNLEKLLFDYSAFNSFKELKAEINYQLFGRVDKDVVISSDGKYLFYKETVEKNDSHSSFNLLSHEKLDNVVHSLNYVSEKYKNEGFDEVYFSVMPNPATILEKNMGAYNQFLPSLIEHPDLHAKVIDVYYDFKRSNVQLYYNSDTHWNWNGYYTWLDKFYKELEKINAKQDSIK